MFRNRSFRLFSLVFAVHRRPRKLVQEKKSLIQLAKQKNSAMKLVGSSKVNFYNGTSKLKSCIPQFVLRANKSGVNQAGTMFVAKVKHPAGDIAQLLVLNGLARCADWMSPLLGGEGMQKLRDAERYNISQTEVNDRQAKARKLNLWRGHTAKAAQTTASFDAVVLKIVNGDTIEVGPKQGVGRRTIQFSSIRQPKSPPLAHTT